MAIFQKIDFARFSLLVRESTSSTTLLDSGSLLLNQTGDVTTHWSPFEHTPKTARLVICGITPGRTQALNALTAFREALNAGCDQPEALRLAKLTGSFSGAMRTNIVHMLDTLNTHKLLRVNSCAELFNPGKELVHMTSALRYPVFVRGDNYNGNPSMLRTPELRDMVESFLVEEARLLPNALWLPLGPKPTKALDHLIKQGVLKEETVLRGLPHPSGANAERIAYFLGNKTRDKLSIKTRPDLIDAAKNKLIDQISRI